MEQYPARNSHPFTLPQVAAVVGGSGFIGNAVVGALLEAGVGEVRNLDLMPGPRNHPHLHHFQGSFQQSAIARTALAGADCVYHLAATGFVREANANPLNDAQENVIGTIQLLDLAREAGVGRFLFCSSGGAVYGQTSGDTPIHEDIPTRPLNAYGASKLACETYVRLYNSDHGMRTLTLRVANPYGQGQNIARAQGALTTFCYRAVRRETITIWGDGSVVRDYIHVRDVAEAMLLAATAGAHGTEINVGSGEGVSLLELVELIKDLIGEAPDVSYTEGRSFDVPRNVLDIGRAREMLGWTPRTCLREGVAALISMLQEQSGRQLQNPTLNWPGPPLR